MQNNLFWALFYVLISLYVYVYKINGYHKTPEFKSILNNLESCYKPNRKLINLRDLKYYLNKQYYKFIIKDLSLYHECKLTYQFYKILEFVTAEIILRYCYFIYNVGSTNEKQDCLERIDEILFMYEKIFPENKHLIYYSLKCRILSNLSHLNHDIESILEILYTYFDKELITVSNDFKNHKFVESGLQFDKNDLKKFAVHVANLKI
jgi:hypothetical protein